MNKIKNKKAISLMLGYVLLIAIALILSAGIYTWLKVYIPKDNEVCSPDISLSLQSYECDLNSDPKTIKIELRNSGLFSVDGIFVRGAENEEDLPILLFDRTSRGLEGGRWDFENKLKPNEIKKLTLKYPDGAASLKKIQIQAFVYGKKGILLCENILNQPLENC